MTNKLSSKTEWVRDYDGWNDVKKILGQSGELPKFSERDIWFLSVGTNVGSEVDGKNDGFERPVLILKKYSDTMFFGLPMSSVVRRGSWFYRLKTKSRETTILLNQGRIFSACRLIRKIRFHMSVDEFEIVKKRFRHLI